MPIIGCDAGDRPLAQVSFSNGSVLAAQTTQDGAFTLTATGPSPVQVWSAGQEAPVYNWYQGESVESIILLASSPDSQYAATATEKTVAIWSLLGGHNLGFYELTQSLRTLALSDGGRNLLLGYQDGTVEFVDLQTGRRLLFLGHQSLKGENRINSVDLSANGRYALSASLDGQVLLWQTTDASVLSEWQQENSVTVVRLDAQGKLAFSADAQGQGEVRQLPSGELLSKLQVPYRGQTFVSARLDAKHNRILTGSTARRLELWQLDNGRLLQEWQVGIHTNLRPASAIVYDATFIDDTFINGTVADGTAIKATAIYSVSSSGLGETWALSKKNQRNLENQIHD
ncbi:WD40 repeat domain-containing protein [Oceanisphaera sp. W20_SRM_FM3]